MKANHKNVTISLPEELLRQFRVYAAARNQSMTELIANAITKMIADAPEDEARIRRIIERLDNPPGRGSGEVTWKREDIYDRVR